jgi:predicted Zn-dependent protease
MKYVPKEMTTEVNFTKVHPLVNFSSLLGTIAFVGITLYAGLGVVAERLAARIGPETEEKIGNVLFQSMFTDTNFLLDDSRVDYLQTLTESLSPEAGLTHRPSLKVHILEESLPNAMVIPGGYVFVTTGLLAETETENELAFVLAHELGHFQARDPLRGLGRSLVFTVLSSVLGVGNANLPQVFPVVTNLANLQYSRAQEAAADRYALTVILDRYGHGGYSLEFFRKIRTQELDLGAFNPVVEWQSTHPLAEGRIQALERLAEEFQWPMSGTPTALPEGLACPNFDPCQ